MSDPVEDAVRSMLGKDKSEKSVPPPPDARDRWLARLRTKRVLVVLALSAAVCLFGIGAVLLGSLGESWFTAAVTGTCDRQVRTLIIPKGVTKALNPGGHCDLTYAITKGEVEFQGPNGGYKVDVNDAVVGRKDIKILVEARATIGDAELYYMLCPLGKGPTDGGWTCKP